MPNSDLAARALRKVSGEPVSISALTSFPSRIRGMVTSLCPGSIVTGISASSLCGQRPISSRQREDLKNVAFPAAGSLNSSVRVAPERLATLVALRWVDICRLPGTGDASETLPG